MFVSKDLAVATKLVGCSNKIGYAMLNVDDFTCPDGFHSFTLRYPSLFLFSFLYNRVCLAPQGSLERLEMKDHR